jgi:enoyl-CoA hydratase/carnithine racemase
MFTSDEALRVGMVDQVVPLEEVNAAAYDTMDLWLSVPGKY